MMDSTDPLADSFRFSHGAMNTTFTLRIRGQEESVARWMARECFEKIDAMEKVLSRFREGSDIWQINRLAAGESLYLNNECHECLLIALEAKAATGGLFDITLGQIIEHRKAGDDGAVPVLTGILAVHPDTPAVTCIEAGREIDLGGIGKGFALDRLRLLLRDWGCEDALLAAGASSMLAIGPSMWPVDLPSDVSPLRIHLTDGGMSASGTGIQGAHIVHPAGDGALPAEPFRRVWVVADDAAHAEVWSTALMLVDAGAAAELAAGAPYFRAAFADTASGVRRLV